MLVSTLFYAQLALFAPERTKKGTGCEPMPLFETPPAPRRRSTAAISLRAA
jgi:hypothetical protein